MEPVFAAADVQTMPGAWVETSGNKRERGSGFQEVPKGPHVGRTILDNVL